MGQTSTSASASSHKLLSVYHWSAQMKPFFKVIAIYLFLSSCILPSSALDPLYSTSWSRRGSSTRNTQRRSNFIHHRQARPVSYYRTRRDYSDKILDVDDFRKDRRSRLWDLKITARRPGKYSWTSRLVIANVVCYALQVFFPRVTQMGVKLSDRILSGEQLYRLLTPVFLHGGLAHLFMNMVSLRNVGPDVEKLFGSGRYLATYLGAGVAGNLLSAVQSPNPALGASGAIFGIIGAQLVFLTRNDWLLGNQGERMQEAIFQTIALNLFIGFMNPMVDNYGHLGGLIGGAAAAYYFGPRLYLMELPEGGRYLVDKPVVRLPRSIESIPEKVARRCQRLTRRIQVNQHTSDLPDKPWRSPRQQNVPRQSAPNRSVKPKRFW